MMQLFHKNRYLFVNTTALNQSVKRNMERFPEDFMFQLTTEETQAWKSQIVTSNRLRHKPKRYNLLQQEKAEGTFSISIEYLIDTCHLLFFVPFQ